MKSLLLLIIILLLNKSNEIFNLTKRIEGAVKFILSSSENILINNDTYIIKYPKFEIKMANFKIISPLLDNLKLKEKEVSSTEYIFENINIGYFFDTEICYKGNNINKKDNYLESIVTMKFKYFEKDDFLSFDSKNLINSAENLTIDFGLESLDFFRDLKERKPCVCQKDKEEKFENPYLFFVDILKEKTEIYISKVISLNALLTYDAYIIFNNTLKQIECSDETKSKYNIEYIKINQIFFFSDKIEPQLNLRNKLWIHQIFYKGIYKSLKYNKEMYFSFRLDEDKENIIMLINEKLTFIMDDLVFFCELCNETEEKEALQFAISKDYKKILDKSNEDYYQSN